jgi:hypothetical protein
MFENGRVGDLGVEGRSSVKRDTRQIRRESVDSTHLGQDSSSDGLLTTRQTLRVRRCSWQRRFGLWIVTLGNEFRTHLAPYLKKNGLCPLYFSKSW